MALIEVAGIHVRFGDRVVLESIDLAVPEGEFHGLMGPTWRWQNHLLQCAYRPR